MTTAPARVRSRSPHQALASALEAVIASHAFETPAGTMVCRLCDEDIEAPGGMHAADCVLHEARAALASFKRQIVTTGGRRRA